MERIGRYQLRGELGRGGVGAVLRAYDPEQGDEVAIKLLLGGGRARELARKRFAREIRALSMLRHPHVVAVRDTGEHRGDPYLVLELVEGETLAEVVQRRGPLPVERALELVIKLARALEYVHQQGVLHRDLKPENVLLDAQGEPRLTDFGLTRDVDDSGAQTVLTASGQGLGTPDYWAPEQALGTVAAVGPATDVYGLGAILVTLLTGAPPHGQSESLLEAMARAQEPPPPPSTLRPGLDPALDAVCLRALAVEPGRRHPSPAALALDLQALLEAQRARRTGPAGRPAWVWVAGAVLAASLGGGALRVAQRRPARTGSQVTPVAAGAVASEDAPGRPPLDSQSRARALVERGDALAEARRFQEAFDAFTEAILLDPRLGRAFAKRGRLRAELGDVQAGLEDCERAVAVAPAEPAVWRVRGALRAQLNQPRRALSDYTRALELSPPGDPSRGKILAERGAVRRLGEDFDGAFADWDEAIRLSPDYALTYFNRACLLFAQGQREAALEDLQRAIDLEPSEKLYYEMRANWHLLAREFERALADAETLRTLDPEGVVGDFLRGQALNAQRDFAGAVEALERVVDRKPDFARAYHELGLARSRLGDAQGALIAFFTAAKLDPDADWSDSARRGAEEARARLRDRQE